MDNITHSLTGLALSRAGLKQFSPRATALLILSANAPDVDIVALRGGALRYLEMHRGYTHSLLCLPLMAALCVLVIAAASRRKLPWMRAWLLCCLGLGSHLLLDWTNSYGIRALLPFSSRWFHSDLNGLYDVWILAVLIFAALWPLFTGLVSREIGARTPGGRGSAWFALLFFVFFDIARFILHGRAIDQLESRLYGDAPAIRAAALPDSFTPLTWTGVVEGAEAYRLLDINVTGQLDLATAETFYKPTVTPALEAVNTTPPFRYFRYFARFPVWSELPVTTSSGEYRRFDLSDLRFGAPGRGSFHCIALTDHDNHVLGSTFTYGSGANLGWGK
ncbi:MAG: metal-dependent hydrolase [Acidobacteriaceae bacterium]|nr:metal-dependent hydrolase [Acidobacteriaceae bacterium]MBV9502358.1 metal-dependent hydrolase [Acidobacteriaceae bacterium]